MHLNNAHIPAGLVDDKVEYFHQDGKALAMFRSGITHISHLPENVLTEVESKIDANAQTALDELGLKKRMHRIEQFIICRFGAFDFMPDHDTSGIGESEYWECGQRGKCAHEGKLCCTVKADFGIISKREISIIKLIALGLSDKEIANALGISVNTMVAHMRNIKTKTGAKSKVDIAVFAIQKNIYAAGTGK